MQAFKEQCPQFLFQDQGYLYVDSVQSPFSSTHWFKKDYREHIHELLKWINFNETDHPVTVIFDSDLFVKWLWIEESHDVHLAIVNAIRFDPTFISMADINRKTPYRVYRLSSSQ